MAGKFEVYEDASGKFRFHLKTSNGEVVASGHGYATKASAKAGCEAVLRAALSAPMVEARHVSMALEGSDGSVSSADLGSDDVTADEAARLLASCDDELEAAARDERVRRFIGSISVESDFAERAEHLAPEGLGRG